MNDIVFYQKDKNTIQNLCDAILDAMEFQAFPPDSTRSEIENVLNHCFKANPPSAEYSGDRRLMMRLSKLSDDDYKELLSFYLNQWGKILENLKREYGEGYTGDGNKTSAPSVADLYAPYIKFLTKERVFNNQKERLEHCTAVLTSYGYEVGCDALRKNYRANSVKTLTEVRNIKLRSSSKELLQYEREKIIKAVLNDAVGNKVNIRQFSNLETELQKIIAFSDRLLKGTSRDKLPNKDSVYWVIRAFNEFDNSSNAEPALANIPKLLPFIDKLILANKV